VSERKTNTGGREATLSVIPGKFALSVGKPRLPEPAGFTWTKLTDVARIESGHTPSRTKEEYWNGPIPWIGIREATGNHGKTIYETSQSITELGLNNSSTRLLPAETVCLSRTASVGYVVKMGVPMATSQDFVNWVCGPQLSSSYLMYILMAEQDSVRRFSHGTTHQTMYYPEAKALNVLIPPRPEQDGIVEVLGALDDKIAVNTKMVQSAEELLQCSYRGLINAVPSTRVLVESLIHRITPKRKFSKEELLTQGDFPVFDQSEVGLLGYLNGEGFLDSSAERPILYFGDHTCKLRLASERFTVGPNTVPFTGSGIPSLTLYCALNGLQNHEEYKRHWQLLLKKEVEIPDSVQATDFASRYRHLLKVIQSANRENTLLAATRDVLLPQLMSGKLRVKDAENVLERAGV
jgi:type I restriction enzyme S subunit